LEEINELDFRMPGMINMAIRKANVADAQVIMNLHERSVLGLCADDYSQEQIKGWLAQSNLKKYQHRLKQHHSFIAEVDGKTAGYVRWNPETNELCSIFVDPDFVRQGIASDLMRIAERDALNLNVSEFWLDASLTAVPFYEDQGWTYVELSTHGPLECVRMTKQLPEESGD
jgi:putative acetyltransferase